jgi:hypothetical protein
MTLNAGAAPFDLPGLTAGANLSSIAISAPVRVYALVAAGVPARIVRSQVAGFFMPS